MLWSVSEVCRVPRGAGDNWSELNRKVKSSDEGSWFVHIEEAGEQKGSPGLVVEKEKMSQIKEHARSPGQCGSVG